MSDENEELRDSEWQRTFSLFYISVSWINSYFTIMKLLFAKGVSIPERSAERNLKYFSCEFAHLTDAQESITLQKLISRHFDSI